MVLEYLPGGSLEDRLAAGAPRRTWVGKGAKL